MMAWCMWSLMLFYSLSPWVLICHRADQDAQYLEFGSNAFNILNIPASALGIPALGSVGETLGKMKSAAQAREQTFDKRRSLFRRCDQS